MDVHAGSLALGGESAQAVWCDPIDEPWLPVLAGDGGAALVFDVGEGSYAAYWGFDRAGELCELSIDTGLLTRGVWRDVPFSLPLQQADVDAADARFAIASVHAAIESQLVLRLDGDVRRLWFGRVVDHDSKEIGSSFEPDVSQEEETLCQRYDCAPWRSHGGVGLRVRMIFPDEPLEPLSG